MISLKELKVKYDHNDGFAPKSADEKRFRDMHTRNVKVTPDANKNGDDVFKGTNIKAVDRPSTRHGYNAGKDVEVYEDVEQSTDSISAPRRSIKAAQAAMKKSGTEKGEPITKITPAQGDKVMEDTINEIDCWPGYRKMGKKKSPTRPGKMVNDCKKIKEDVEELDELSYEKLDKYKRAAKRQMYALTGAGVKSGGTSKSSKKLDKRIAGYRTAWGKQEKMAEDIELDEVLKPSMGAAAYIHDFVDSKDPKFAGKSKKERMKQALAAYYSAKRGD